MKRLLLILILILNTTIAYANVENLNRVENQTSYTQPQNIAFENCTKMFAVKKEKLFYLTLSAITANKFSIDEIQTENGYIIFSAANNKYLATVSGIDADNSILKITPCNNIYFFAPGIFLNMFKYIDINLNMDIK